MKSPYRLDPEFLRKLLGKPAPEENIPVDEELDEEKEEKEEPSEDSKLTKTLSLALGDTLKTKDSLVTAGTAGTAGEEKKSKATDKEMGISKVLYGNFKHLLIRKSGPGFRMERYDKNPDPKKRK